MSEHDIMQGGQKTREAKIEKPSFNRLQQCSNDLEELLAEYGSVLSPKIVEYEVEKCEFPVEVLNEIRSIYAHLYRASISEGSDVSSNIRKAKSHSKRAILDCYKYLCIAYDDRYHDFFRKFDYINWSKSNLEQKIVEIDKMRSAAVTNLKNAKIRESTEKGSGSCNQDSGTDDYRSVYKQAYEKYLQLTEMLEELEDTIVNTPTVVSKFPGQWVALIGLGCIILGFFIGYFI